MKDPGGLGPSVLVSDLDETLVLCVLLEVGDLVAVAVVEGQGVRVARDDDVVPVAHAGEQALLVHLGREMGVL